MKYEFVFCKNNSVKNAFLKDQMNINRCPTIQIKQLSTQYVIIMFKYGDF